MTKKEFKLKLAKLEADVEKQARDLDLTHFKEALQITRTGEGDDGSKYNDTGQLNQAAWIGENAAILILEIEKLRRHRALLASVIHRGLRVIQPVARRTPGQTAGEWLTWEKSARMELKHTRQENK